MSARWEQIAYEAALKIAPGTTVRSSESNEVPVFYMYNERWKATLQLPRYSLPRLTVMERDSFVEKCGSVEEAKALVSSEADLCIQGLLFGIGDECPN
jgi:hypothetical protein